MPLVPAKCTICGALLNIDSGREAAVCESCGNAFVVEKAINNYNTYNSVVNNISGDNVVINIESEKERLHIRAETHIKLGETLKALALYRELVEKYPEDWRGWWGEIYYHYGYGNIRGLYSDEGLTELELKMASFRKIAPPEAYARLDEIIKKRIEDVNAVIEREHLDKLANLQVSFDDAITASTERIDELKARLSEASSNQTNLQSELNKAINERERIEAEEKRMKNRKESMEWIPILGIIAVIVFGILGLLDGAQFFLVLVVCGLIGAGVWFVLTLLSEGLIAFFVRLPADELKNAQLKENNLKQSTDDSTSQIASLKGALEHCERRIEYMQQNRNEIISSMDKHERPTWGSQNIYDLVDERMRR